MKKITAVICLLLAAALALGGCSQQGSEAPAESSGAEVIVAKVNGEAITYDEYYTVLSQILDYIGISADSSDADFYKEDVVSRLVYEKVLKRKLTEEGYMNLTPEQNAQAQQSATESFKAYIESSYFDEIQDMLGDDYTDAEYDAAVDKVMQEHLQEELDKAGMTWEELLDSYRLPVAEEAAWAELTADAVPTEDEVKKSYDENVAADKADMEEDPTVYEFAVMDGTTIYYVPGGLRLIKHVLIKIDEEASDAVALLRDNGFDAQADLLLESALADIQAKADEVLAKIQSGEMTFDEAVAQHNEDTGMPEGGYPVYKDSGSYMKAFVTGAYALANVGDISDLVATDYGYHILLYAGDTVAGPVPYESVKDEIYETLKATLQSERWNEITDEWVAQSDVEFYPENY
ncbi:MAG: peptidylprolyl isomerase [Christensenellales bacterium]